MDYHYTRAVVNADYDIDNPVRVDLEGNPILLINEIKTSEIATVISKITLQGSDCDITFPTALSAGDKTLLDTIVANHKANT